MSNEAKIVVTDEQISKYRSRYDLNARTWQDQAVRGYVVALSTQLTIAKMAGWESTVTDITATLVRFEPLHEQLEHSYAGRVLWIAYTYYCAKDLPATLAAIGVSLKQWPENKRLLRMREVIAQQ